MELKVKNENPLSKMRDHIDSIDDAIFSKLAERFKVTDEVGRYKAEMGLNSRDHEREAIQFKKAEELARNHGLDVGFCKSYLKSVVDQVVKNHEKIAIKHRRSESGNEN